MALSKLKMKKFSMPALTHARFSLKEQVHFAKRLSFLMSAGVPLVEGLHIMQDQMKGGARGRMMHHVLSDISSGQSLSRSFSKFPAVFGEFTISIIKIGESSGTLTQNLAYLAEELKKRQILGRKIVSAFIYPAIISVVMLGVTAFLMLYLFPKIMPVFASLHTELPLTTRIVMAMSLFLQHWWLWIFVGGVAITVVMLIAIKRSKKLRFMAHWMLLRTPVIGGVIRSYNLANSLRTLGLLLSSGIRFSEALPITADTSKNLVYRKEFREMSTVVNRGERISTYLRTREAYFPSIMTHMIAVGERSGSLSETCVYLSDLYEHEVDEFTKNLSTMIEPALMVVMGVIVGFIAVSIITPIYSITQNLHA